MAWCSEILSSQVSSPPEVFLQTPATCVLTCCFLAPQTCADCLSKVRQGEVGNVTFITRSATSDWARKIYTWSRLNRRPSAWEADVIATRPQVLADGGSQANIYTTNFCNPSNAFQPFKASSEGISFHKGVVRLCCFAGFVISAQCYLYLFQTRCCHHVVKQETPKTTNKCIRSCLRWWSPCCRFHCFNDAGKMNEVKPCICTHCNMMLYVYV